MVLRFLYRHPPRPGWQMFLLASGTVLLLPSMMLYSPLAVAAGPMLLGCWSGLILGFAGGRYLRPLMPLLAIFVLLWLLQLIPPWRIFEEDLRTLLTWRGPRNPLLLPAATMAAFTSTESLLQAAWDGNPGALNWAISHLLAVFGFFAAGILGFGLRRRAMLLPWCLPLIAAIVSTAITVRLGMGYVMGGIFVTLLAAIFGSFRGREHQWDQAGVGYSEVLRWDVAMGGGALLVVVIVIGSLIPSRPRNTVTTWIWTGVQLPAGLARLDTTDGSEGDDPEMTRGRAPVGRLRPGDDLALGYSLEAAESERLSLRIWAEGISPEVGPYWRGRVYERYLGRGWTTGTLRMVPRQPFQVGEFDTNLIRQEFTDVLVGRGQRFGLPDIVGFDGQATVEETTLGDAVGWVGAGATYTVYSRPPAPLANSVPELIQLQTTLTPYRQVPTTLPRRVVDLTNQITDNAASQVGRAIAIETYLRSLNYSYEVELLPPTGDAVDQFLFTMRSGYCTYYASAMAIMARIAGIPSRVAVGYATGEYDPENAVFNVRESDAHAWTELYIDGQGWTRWEPTPIRPVPARSRLPEQAPLLPATVDPLPETGTASTALGIAIIVVVMVLLVLTIRQWVGRSSPMTPAAVHVALYRYGRRAGIRPAVGDSVEDYARRLAGVSPVLERPLTRVGRLLTARLYRQSPLSADEERTLVRDWHIVRDLLRRKPSERL